jgi:hypothetical protein
VRLAAVVLVLLTACGRLSFDDRGDAETGSGGHDEDMDGLADAVDPCPHVAGDAADSDGDGVGDACDPEPTNPRQHWALFDPLTSDTAFTKVSGAWVHTGDALRCDTADDYGQLRRDVAFRLGVYDVGIDIVSRTPGSAKYQIAAAVLSDVAQPYYYVEMYESPPDAQYAAVSKFDGATFATVQRTTLADGVHTGSAVLRFVAEPTTKVGVETEWPSESYSLSLSAPDYGGGSLIDIRAFGLVVEVRYVAVIATTM